LRETTDNEGIHHTKNDVTNLMVVCAEHLLDKAEIKFYLFPQKQVTVEKVPHDIHYT
jgi:hypothetical protein